MVEKAEVCNCIILNFEVGSLFWASLIVIFLYSHETSTKYDMEIVALSNYISFRGLSNVSVEAPHLEIFFFFSSLSLGFLIKLLLGLSISSNYWKSIWGII